MCIITIITLFIYYIIIMGAHTFLPGPIAHMLTPTLSMKRVNIHTEEVR